MDTSPVPHNHIAIIGTGFAAIATGYPGAAVDVKSRLYSLSFAPNSVGRALGLAPMCGRRVRGIFGICPCGA